jgi:MFS family permease
MLLDRIGRKPLLVLAAFVYTIGSTLQSLAPTYGALMKLRVFAGMAPGILQATVPVYLSEFCDPTSRGFYVSAYNVGYPVGACFFVALVAALNGQWRASFAVSVAPGVLMLACLAYLPESPRFLAVSGQHEKAKSVVELMYRLSGRALPPLRAEQVPVQTTDEAMGPPPSAYLKSFARIVPLYACLAFASVGVRNWLPTFFTSQDFPYYSVFFMNAMDLMGCLVGAWGAERYGCATVITAGFAGSAASTMPLTLCTSLVSRSLLGGLQQAMQAVVWVSLGTLSCEAFPTHCRGRYMGVIFIIITLSTSLAPIVGGYYFAQGIEAQVTAISAYGFTYLLGAFGSLLLLVGIQRVDTVFYKTVTTYGATNSTGKQK